MSRDAKLVGFYFTGALLFFAVAAMASVIVSSAGLTFDPKYLRVTAGGLGLVHLALFYRKLFSPVPKKA